MRQFLTLAFVSLIAAPAVADHTDEPLVRHVEAREGDTRETVQLPVEFFAGGLVGGVEAQQSWQWVYINGYAYRAFDRRSRASGPVTPFPPQSRPLRQPDYRQHGSDVPPQDVWRRRQGH